MRTAVNRVDVVGKRKNQFIVAVVVLHRNFRKGIAFRSGDVNDIIRQRFQSTLGMNMLYKLPDSAFIVQYFLQRLFRIPLIGKNDLNAGIQERLLPQPLEQYVVVVFCMFKNGAVCLKANHGTRFCGVTDDFQRFPVIAPFKSLEVDMAAVFDSQFQPFRQGIDNGSAHSVQTAGHFIAAAAEFSAGMQDGVDNRCGRNAFLRVNADRNTTAVVGNPDDIAGQNIHGNFGTESGKRLVNGVVHNFIDQMMQSLRAGRTNVHTWPLPNCLQSFQHLNLTFIILLCHWLLFFCHSSISSCSAVPVKQIPPHGHFSFHNIFHNLWKVEFPVDSLNPDKFFRLSTKFAALPIVESTFPHGRSSERPACLSQWYRPPAAGSDPARP